MIVARIIGARRVAKRRSSASSSSARNACNASNASWIALQLGAGCLDVGSGCEQLRSQQAAPAAAAPVGARAACRDRRRGRPRSRACCVRSGCCNRSPSGRRLDVSTRSRRCEYLGSGRVGTPRRAFVRACGGRAHVPGAGRGDQPRTTVLVGNARRSQCVSQELPVQSPSGHPVRHSPASTRSRASIARCPA